MMLSCASYGSAPRRQGWHRRDGVHSPEAFRAHDCAHACRLKRRGAAKVRRQTRRRAIEPLMRDALDRLCDGPQGLIGMCVVSELAHVPVNLDTLDSGQHLALGARGECRKWAESAPTTVASGRTGVRARSRHSIARNRLHRPKQASIVGVDAEFRRSWTHP